MTLRTRRLIQQLTVFTVAAVMIFAQNSLVTLNARVMITVVILLAALAITMAAGRRRTISGEYSGENRGEMLVSTLDFAWLPFILLTGLTVITAQFPRRSVEQWLWQLGLQLPVAYATLVIFRRGWPQRSIYRALLGVGGFLYMQALLLTVTYYSDAMLARANGLTPPGFRLFGLLNHPNILAMVVAISTPCIVGYVFVAMKRAERIACILWLAGAAMTLYGTASRTGTIATMLGVGCAVLLALLAHPNQPLSRITKWAQVHRTLAAISGVIALLLVAVALVAVIALQSGRPLQDDGGGRVAFFRMAIDMFKSSPFVGVGPGGFVVSELRTQSVPGFPMMPHAHNIILNSAAESGVPGLIGIAALLIVGGFVCFKVWRVQPERRSLVAGAIGGLVAFAIFGLLDSPISDPGAFFIAVILLGFVGSGLPASAKASRTSRQRTWLIVASAWGVTLLCVLSLIPYSQLWAVTGPGTTAVSATQAAQRIDSILAYDPNDGLARLQSAYDWGRAVENGKADVLQMAIMRFEQAIPLDPYLGLHHMNLAALYRQAGRIRDAVIEARVATERAADDPIVWLNYAVAQEENSDTDGAITSYVNALIRDPDWARAGFWDETPTRRTALKEFYRAEPDEQAFNTSIAAGNAVRVSGRTDEAVQAYTLALKDASSDRTALVQGLIALTKGDSATAEKTFRQLMLTGSGDPMIDAHLYLGDLLITQGKVDDGLNEYNIAYQYVVNRALDGFGMQGNYGYAVVAFQRYGRITDYLPGIMRLDANPERAIRFKILARRFLTIRNVQEATSIYKLILQTNPQDAAAASALSDLMPF